MGLLWQRYRESFPKLEVYPALDPRFERSGLALEKGLKVKFETVPAPRVWFIGSNEAHLVQVQQDRFVFNWRRIEGDDYPRYEHVKASFQEHFRIFQEFLAEEQLGETRLNQWELTYVNHIPAGDGWHRHGELGLVVPLLVGCTEGEFLPEPEDIALQVRYPIPNGAGAVSRLYVVANPGFDPSGKPVLGLTLTARGGLDQDSESSLESRLDVGREWIVRGFAEVTSKTMHQHWGAREVTTFELVADPQADSWSRGLTDSGAPRIRRISFTEQPAPVLFLTAPRHSMSPAPSHEFPWLDDVKDEMGSYLELAPDWDSYGGGPVPNRIVDAAVVVAEFMATYGFSRPEVCPESSGGVLLEWQQSDRVLTVDLDGIEGFSFAYESLGKPELEGDIEDFFSLLSTGLQPF